jgi:hypothetical protein
MSIIFYGLIFIQIIGLFAVTPANAETVLINPSAVTGSHAGRFSVYEGTRTCLACHETEAREVHASVHYQWRGDSSRTVGLDASSAGKLGGINDFCIYPDINWIGKLTNIDGIQVDGGCAKCHVGLGEKSTSEPDQNQLENIDCLLCHSETYKRKVDLVDGSFRFVPDTDNMTVGLLQAAVDLKRPGNATCLNCHAYAGGGDNFKRGDLEAAHKTPTRDLDVHMASVADGGADLECLDCHTASAHQIAGRGTDLRPLDGAGEVSCTACHDDTPHENRDLDKHTGRLSCTVCHIPAFAKVAGTDMDRDWSRSGVLVAEKGLYEPYHTKEQNVQPVYRFFNGLSYFYQFSDAAMPDADGRVLMAAPLGDIHDPGAKIAPFKRHRATQPMDTLTNRLLPLKIGLFFQSGQVDQAIRAGAQAVEWEYSAHSFVQTERYMGLFHEVASKSQALSCNSCHNGGTRLDFDALGYAPNDTYNGKPLCASCHRDESDEWDENEFFEKVHKKHVQDKRYDCIRCHAFTAAGNDTPGSPRAVTVAATSLRDVSANLHGTVHPNGRTTAVVYEYGTDASYGNSVTAAQSPLSGTWARAVGVALTSLLPDTTYHFRIKATNSDGTAFGEDRTFVTAQSGIAPPTSCPDCSGEAPIVQSVTFNAGSNCRCSGTVSLTIGQGVVIENGAQVTFDAPQIKVKSPFRAEKGAVVKMAP